ncbi:hypothetical protein GGF50DRAFT_37383, partial [Schizophyllum commune]
SRLLCSSSSPFTPAQAIRANATGVCRARRASTLVCLALRTRNSPSPHLHIHHVDRLWSPPRSLPQPTLAASLASLRWYTFSFHPAPAVLSLSAAD